MSLVGAELGPGRGASKVASWKQSVQHLAKHLLETWHKLLLLGIVLWPSRGTTMWVRRKGGGE